MCFSAEASLAASGVLAATSVAIARIPKEKSSIPLSLFPAVFATHQFIEGVLWLTHDGVLPGTTRTVATYAYVLIAFVLWPIFVPFAAYWAELRRPKRIAILVCQAIGLAVGLVLLTSVLRGPVEVSACCGSLFYHVDAAPVLLLPYLIAVSVPFLVSSSRNLLLFGVGILAACGAALVTASVATFPSVWCFFAAILSGGLYLHFRSATQAAAHRPSAGESSRVLHGRA